MRASRQLSPALRRELPSSRLDAAWKRLVGVLGPLRGWRPDAGAALPDGQRAWILELGSGRARATLAFDEGGEVAGLWFSPAPAAAPAGGAPVETAVGEGPLLLGATLVLPGREGRHPAALLLGPGGRADRDGASGVRRPLRDLAGQLAARGIASLRFDRRTVAWPDGPDPQLTVETELVADAARALAQLAARPDVDPARIFVVGFGIAGTVAPEVASRGANAAAVVVVGAPPHPWPLAVVEQARAARPAGSADLALLEKEADRVLLGRLGPDETFRGYPGAYWTDLGGRDPTAWARRLARPALFLRGEQDTLVTESDLKTFRRQLADVPGTAVETIPGADDLLCGKEGGLQPAAGERIADFLLGASPPDPARTAHRTPGREDAPQPGQPARAP